MSMTAKQQRLLLWAMLGIIVVGAAVLVSSGQLPNFLQATVIGGGSITSTRGACYGPIYRSKVNPLEFDCTQTTLRECNRMHQPIDQPMRQPKTTIDYVNYIFVPEKQCAEKPFGHIVTDVIGEGPEMCDPSTGAPTDKLKQECKKKAGNFIAAGKDHAGKALCSAPLVATIFGAPVDTRIKNGVMQCEVECAGIYQCIELAPADDPTTQPSKTTPPL